MRRGRASTKPGWRGARSASAAILPLDRARLSPARTRESLLFGPCSTRSVAPIPALAQATAILDVFN